jgi:S-formylglutathione hydrolase FrmB
MSESWQTIEIRGKPADVYQPAGIERPRFGIIHLHGAGLQTLRDKPTFTRLFEKLKLCCVCPRGQRSWWANRICSEFDRERTAEQYLLEQIVPFFNDRWKLAPPGIGLQGICMGGQGALRLAFRYPDLFPVVAAISPAVDYHELYGQGTPLDEMYDSKEQCRQDTVILHVHPSNYPRHIFFCVDPEDRMWYRGNDRLHEKLSALCIPHEVDLTTSVGDHNWDYFRGMAEKIEQFIFAGLEHESRRLL